MNSSPSHNISRRAGLLSTYLYNMDDVLEADKIASRGGIIGPDEAWAGIVLIAVGVENAVSRPVRRGLVVIGRSGILGESGHPEYETAWTIIRELGERSTDLCDQAEDNSEILYWSELGVAIARTCEAAGV